MRRGTDRVFLKGLEFHGRCGVTEEERRTRRKILVGMEVVTSLAKAGKSDDLGDTVDYRELYSLAKKVIQGKAVSLVERWAEMIAEEVMKKFKVSEVRVKIQKPGVIAKGVVPGVEVVRTKA